MTKEKFPFYEGSAVFADPIHTYITFTLPNSSTEASEKDLIDTPWMQRLRKIYQLQSLRWVFPSAEHSRFQHSLGAMHLGGRMAKQLYPSLKKYSRNCPSFNFIEELLRITGLLHDIGHGPFGHFFDENYLDKFHITHEDLGKKIIFEKLSDIILKIKRSPSGKFMKGEVIQPEYLAFLIKKEKVKKTKNYPKWLTLLLPLFNGIYTVDNMDYVLRDSYMCGVKIGPVDIERLIYYTFYSSKGLTIHKSGTSALTMFLNARLYLYSNVYYHRTTRAIDHHLREIFRDTITIMFDGENPANNLNRYLNLTDWSLTETVTSWKDSMDFKKKMLAKEWSLILLRKPKWKLAFDYTRTADVMKAGVPVISEKEWAERIRENLPEKLKDLSFSVDVQEQDPRPENPLSMGNQQIFVFDPNSESISKEVLLKLFEFIPSKLFHYRVFALDHKNDRILGKIAMESLGYSKKIQKTETNI
ncbi:MAG: HD domain-containing protein [Candidatus Schekmanbacteria bacterium]|nr:MAG: HD domain-containing protein [Candidatus Schekmanbacteria bacterium]